MIIAKITRELHNKVERKQGGRCANSPQSPIRELNSYKCPLWKNTRYPGIFQNAYFDDNFTKSAVLKIDPDEDDNLNNLIAICKDCFYVYMHGSDDRSEGEIYDQADSGSPEVTTQVSSTTNPMPVITPGLECCVCMDEIKYKIVLVPCGHARICAVCVDKLIIKRCPLCRRIIQKYMRYYD